MQPRINLVKNLKKGTGHTSPTSATELDCLTGLSKTAELFP